MDEERSPNPPSDVRKVVIGAISVIAAAALLGYFILSVILGG